MSTMSNICYITMNDGTIQTAAYGDRSIDGPEIQGDGTLVVKSAYKTVARFNHGDWKSFSNSAPVTASPATQDELNKMDLNKMFAEITNILFESRQKP